MSEQKSLGPNFVEKVREKFRKEIFSQEEINLFAPYFKNVFEVAILDGFRKYPKFNVTIEFEPLEKIGFLTSADHRFGNETIIKFQKALDWFLLSNSLDYLVTNLFVNRVSRGVTLSLDFTKRR